MSQFAHSRRWLSALVLVAHALAFSHVALVLHGDSALSHELIDAAHELHCSHLNHGGAVRHTPAPTPAAHGEERCEALHFTQASASISSARAQLLPRHVESSDVVVRSFFAESSVALLHVAPKLSPPARG